MRRHSLAAIAVALVLLLVTAAAARSDEELLGPMVGWVGPTEAWIWAHAGPSPDLAVRVWPEGDQSAARVVAMTAREEERWAAKATIADLTPDTAYAYAILRGGAPAGENAGGRFRTAPPPGKPAVFTIGTSSCTHARRHPRQPSYLRMLAEKPSFHLLLGDVVYANTTDPERQWFAHRIQRKVPEFAEIIRNVPTMTMWDDHDYGWNDSDGTQPGKERSLETFGHLWANPGRGTDEIPGAFYEFSWADVDFFMLDGRYHRSPNKAPDDDAKRMLGDEQFRWLIDRLKQSKARFKVLASGSTFNSNKHDGWRGYTFARRRLMAAIMGNDIDGVIYLSGDIHRCAVVRHAPDLTGGYPLYEVISSGIGNGFSRGFAMLTFDTTAADPSLRVRIINEDGKMPTDRTIRLSELTTGDAPKPPTPGDAKKVY